MIDPPDWRTAPLQLLQSVYSVHLYVYI